MQLARRNLGIGGTLVHQDLRPALVLVAGPGLARAAGQLGFGFDALTFLGLHNGLGGFGGLHHGILIVLELGEPLAVWPAEYTEPAGDGDDHGFATRDGAERWVEVGSAESEWVQGLARSGFNVPVVAEHVEMGRVDIAALDGSQNEHLGGAVMPSRSAMVASTVRVSVWAR